MAASDNTTSAPDQTQSNAASSSASADKKCCPTCQCELKSGMKYENICTTCQPLYLNHCSGCQRRLWDCMCIKPHTWE
jgi:hypothetical protein